MLSFVLVLEAIRNQSEERLELVGNWLYCLRNRVLDPPGGSSSRRRRSGQASAQGSDSSPTDRHRRPEDIGTPVGEGSSGDRSGEGARAPRGAAQTQPLLRVDVESLDETSNKLSHASDYISQWAREVRVASSQSLREKVQLRSYTFDADLASSHLPLRPEIKSPF